jgi:hypothetical protein
VFWKATAGWREDPVLGEKKGKAGLQGMVNLRITSPLATG